ncbi:hypothetical protein G6038_06575 [Rhodococcus sp. 14C212]|uniref:hypothetical protein n=1 Tax=Rhodococcus sp. 14C212 TaxID=2711209 RepID=UPI0013ECBAEB|nr:hypothetical protein [Rhodococcus sp. 14C212]NGP05152.1 hypothetical protein [Rhodococcus sp. 14C212]
MTTSQKRLVLVGNPSDAAEVRHWAAVRRWAAHHGWETTRTVAGRTPWCAIVTEEVLTGNCSPAETATLDALRAAGIRCVRVHEAPALLAAAVPPLSRPA